MSSSVLDRINRQIKESSRQIKVVERTKEEGLPLSNPIPLEELEKILMQDEVAPAPENGGKDMIFDGLHSFVEWFLANRNKFSEAQIVPLTTLVQTRDMINVGCGCKRKHRIEQADNYYKIFWANNAETDLPVKILEAGGFNSVTFLCHEVPIIKTISTQ